MYPIILAFATAFTVSLLLIPAIIELSGRYKLYDRPTSRKKHRDRVPSMGGIAVFSGVVLGMVVWMPDESFSGIQYVLASFLILFVLGARDDLKAVGPGLKLLVQIVAALILVFFAELRLTSMHGLFGLDEIPSGIEIALSILTILVITNSFNLIDGIDGLLGVIAALVCLTYGLWFYIAGELALSLMAMATLGSILAFLRYNLSPAQIFMGDTGSLFIGFMCALLSIEFIEINSHMDDEVAYRIQNAPLVAMGILLLPLMDTLRVFSLRLIQGKSPFRADRLHAHHILVDRGLTHSRVVMILGLMSFGMTLFFIFFNPLKLALLLAVMMGVFIVYVFVLNAMVKR